MRYALDSASIYPLLFGRLVPCLFDDEASNDTDPSTGDVAAPTGEVPEIKWIHVATEGLYKGHWQGAFDLTPAVLEGFVKNLHADPRYTPGEVEVDGVKLKAGSKPVIQYDYEHASEYPPTEGEIPSKGTPAIAWALDLQTRKNKAGKTTLWALTKLGKLIRQQIADDGYRWVSIAFSLQGTHFETDEDIGPVISSIAFTNHPFLKNLESYAAANRSAGQPRRREIQPEASLTAPNDKPTEGIPMTAPSAPDPNREFRTRICRALGINLLLDDGEIEKAAGDSASKGKGLASVLEALGVADVGAALKALPELTAAANALDDARAELADLMQGQQAMDEAVASSDVAAVMSSKKWTDKSQENPLIAYRRQCIESEVLKLGDKSTPKQRTEARGKGRERFLSEYGVKPGVATAHLGSHLLAAPGGVQLQPPRLPASPQGGQPTIPLGDRNDGAADGAPIDLRGVTGANPTARLIAHLASTNPAFAKLDHLSRCRQAARVQETTELILE